MDLEVFLKELGLNETEAKIYRTLADFDEFTATNLAEKSRVKRTLIYHSIKRLIEMGLVVEFEKNKIKYFKLTSPENLDQLFQTYQQKTSQLHRALENILSNLNQRYVSKGERPFIDIYTGFNGLEKIQNALIREADEVLIFASPFLRQDAKIDAFIKKQIALQEKKGISIKALVKDISKEEPQKRAPIIRGAINVRVKLLPAEEFSLPGQIYIWQDTVAINAIGDETISTIVRNKAIAETFRMIFNALWQRANPPIPESAL